MFWTRWCRGAYSPLRHHLELQESSKKPAKLTAWRVFCFLRLQRSPATSFGLYTKDGASPLDGQFFRQFSEQFPRHFSSTKHAHAGGNFQSTEANHCHWGIITAYLAGCRPLARGFLHTIKRRDISRPLMHNKTVYGVPAVRPDFPLPPEGGLTLVLSFFNDQICLLGLSPFSGLAA